MFDISCVEWNPEPKDLLVVAYGELDFTAQKVNSTTTTTIE